jgi:hypothetical protein
MDISENPLFKTYISCRNTNYNDGSWLVDGKISSSDFKRHLVDSNKGTDFPVWDWTPEKAWDKEALVGVSVGIGIPVFSGCKAVLYHRQKLSTDEKNCAKDK